jgi:(1->4)-alpha-D-glucan 1-alpha-D-glucosylmutase
MAKGFEDTALYRWFPLLALNEVGGEPAAPALGIDGFHREQARLLKDMRHGLIATATHDTKRGEDARMRILALAEIPGDWASAVTEWQALNAPLVGRDSDKRAPTANHEYMLYQTLVGAWPDGPIDDTFSARIQAYAIKAAREGKRATSWTNPQQNYENGLTDFVRGILNPERSAAFLESIAAFSQRTSLLGALNSLSQLTLKLTLPGVPDFFQGTELWDLSLVDPDNRRPVDFEWRRALLDDDADWQTLAESWRDGRIKMRLMRALLRARQAYPALFRDGDYEPLHLDGNDAAHAIGFARRHKRQRLLVIAGRHFATRTEGGRHWPRPWDIGVKEESLSGYVDLLRATDGASPSPGVLPVTVLVKA